MKYFSKKVRVKDWSQRDVGWFKVDIEKTPELAFYPDKDKSDQAVIGPGVHRLTHFTGNWHEDKEANEMMYASIVRELTGDWI